MNDDHERSRTLHRKSVRESFGANRMALGVGIEWRLLSSSVIHFQAMPTITTISFKRQDIWRWIIWFKRHWADPETDGRPSHCVHGSINIRTVRGCGKQGETQITNTRNRDPKTTQATPFEYPLGIVVP